MFVVAKEISLEDVRLGLEKLPDRFFEHPATVFIVTNLNYAEAPRLMPRDAQLAAALNWQEVRLTGATADEYAQQIEELSSALTSGWQTRPSQRTGNPMIVRPSVLVMYREDHKFLLDGVIPKPGQICEHYDLVLASQPWRARMVADFKVHKVLGPLARSLAPGGRLLAIQSWGRDPGLEIIQQLWPEERPFQVDRHELLAALRRELARDAREFNLAALPDEKAVFRYEMHTLPSADRRPHRYFNPVCRLECRHLREQIEDERLDAVVNNGAYLEATQRVLQKKHGGLWFNDEALRRLQAPRLGRALRLRLLLPAPGS